jgi:uncharacterized protein DUF6714
VPELWTLAKFALVTSDAQILQTVQQAFAECRRPEHFTDHTHCRECAEHDEVLRSRDVHTLCFEDVGNPGWDPICFISPEGFAYYLPALARLALAGPVEPYGWYGTQLLFHLCHDGRQNRRLLACTPEQRRAISNFLRHLVETRAAFADNSCCTDDLFQALEIWSDEIHVG